MPSVSTSFLQSKSAQQILVPMKGFDYLLRVSRKPALLQVFKGVAMGVADHDCSIDHGAKLYSRALATRISQRHLEA